MTGPGFKLQSQLSHRWQTQGLRAESGPAPCFYPATALSSCLTVKEWLHLYSPKIRPFEGNHEADVAPVKMNLTPLVYCFNSIILLITIILIETILSIIAYQITPELRGLKQHHRCLWGRRPCAVGLGPLFHKVPSGAAVLSGLDWGRIHSQTHSPGC